MATSFDRVHAVTEADRDVSVGRDVAEILGSWPKWNSCVVALLAVAVEVPVGFDASCECFLSCETIDVAPVAVPLASVDGAERPDSGSVEVPVPIASASSDANSGDCVEVAAGARLPPTPAADPEMSCWICAMRVWTAATESKVTRSHRPSGPGVSSCGRSTQRPSPRGRQPVRGAVQA
jgi:hypothetical protein